MDDESRWAPVAINLDAEEASKVVEILEHLAALIDVDDPDGLRDASGQRSEQLERYLLTDEQFMMLRHPAYMVSQRTTIASRLRVIAAKIEGQLPPEAPEIGRRRPA
jgi:hypothetical protein